MDQRIHLTVNGREHHLDIPTQRLLVDCIRYDLGLTGTKEGCSVGVCGSCTVLLDGEMVASCLVLAVTPGGWCSSSLKWLCLGMCSGKCWSVSAGSMQHLGSEHPWGHRR